MATDDTWTAPLRLESWAGEVRVNLIRSIALSAFYGYHLLNVYVLNPDDGALRGDFHLLVTFITAAWAAAAFLLHRFLMRRQVSPLLPFVASGWDLALLTLLIVTAGGPQSPLVVIYFLIVAAAALRLSLPLVYVTTLGAMAGYLVVLGHYVFVVVGAQRYYASDFVGRIPRAQQAIFLIGLAIAGMLAGQGVRQARRLLRGYPLVIVEAQEP
jgi:hypothetical protein